MSAEPVPDYPDTEELKRIFPAEGEMADLIRAKDWRETPLGNPRHWPASLLTAVSILLGSGYPMEIWWGPEYLRFYNDAYRPLLGPNRHPQFLGRPGKECWGELWDVISPMLDGVMETGTPTFSKDSMLSMTRKDFVEETYVTWSYGPIFLPSGKVGGIFCACDETTKAVLNRRRLATLHDLALSATKEGDDFELATAALAKNPQDIPFALVYSCPKDSSTATLLAQTGLPERSARPQGEIDATASPWSFRFSALSGRRIAISDLSDLMPQKPGGPWPEELTTAVVFSIGNQSQNVAAVAIFGVSPRLELNAEYMEFLGLVARHLETKLDVDTARKRSEAERLRLEAAFMQSPAFMCILRGPQHVFDFVNDQYYLLVGQRDIIGKTVAEALPEVVEQGFVGLLDEVVRTGVPYVGKDTPVRLRRHMGGALEEFFINFVYQPVQEPDGTISGIFVHGIDITEEKRGQREREELLVSERAARSEAERAGQMKDDFLATLSHELRTPLNAILGWSTILSSGTDISDDLRQGLQTIERNARSQTQIIEDLLDMSRIISGKVRLDVQRVDLVAVIRESIETVQAAADAKGIRVTQVLDPLAGPISGDPNRLQQVFWNLLTNSIKFTEKGGRVQVLLERINSHIEVSVIDSGKGISPAFLPHVFARFLQADNSITRQHGGLGLGLAIVKQLVELHGGSIRAKSGGEGLGATFVVDLPLTVVHASSDEVLRRHPAVGSAEQEFSALSLENISVLAVDDEPDARALVKRVLETSGATTVTAASSNEAFELLKTNRFDVIVCDIGMPNEDGYTFIRKVRKIDGVARNLPAVALTAYARSEDRTHALRTGFQMHIAKPVEPAELVAVVASLARSPRGA